MTSARSLHRLIYHSRFSASFPADEADQDYEIGRIIHASIRNNREASITGMLLVHDGQFVQVLEGPALAVRAAYDRIRVDPRHHQARLLHQADGEKRTFGDWNMCAHRLSKADDAILETLTNGVALDLAGLSGERALKLLTAVREVQRSTTARALA
jgi:hypothetical protein